MAKKAIHLLQKDPLRQMNFILSETSIELNHSAECQKKSRKIKIKVVMK